MAQSGTTQTGTLREFKGIDKEILNMMLENPEGLRAKFIIKHLASPRRTIYRRLKVLEKKGLIENIYPIWKFQASCQKWHTLLNSENKIQQHKFSFVLVMEDKPYWWTKRGNYFMKIKDMHFLKEVQWSNTKYSQFKYNEFLIQVFSSSIVFINQKKYWANSAYDCVIEALSDTYELIKFLEAYFNFRFIKDGIPHLRIKSLHQVKIYDELAKRCEKNKNGFIVNINNEKRAWVDFSIPFGLEFGSPNHAPDDERLYSRYVTDIIENKASLPSQQDERIAKLTEVLENQQELINQLLYKPEEKLKPRDSYFG